MKAKLVSLFAVIYGVVFLEGGPLDSKDRWSDIISVDEVERVLRDGGDAAMDQVRKEDSDVTIQSRDGGHAATDQVQRDKQDSDVIIQTRDAATPVHSKGIVTNQSNTDTQNLADQFCGLQETVVKLAQPAAGWYYPSAIKLFRCMGSAGSVSPHVQHCAVTHQQQLTVGIYEFFTNDVDPFVTTINVMNHTGCDLDCVVKANTCKPGFQTFNNKTCDCDCIGDVSMCNSTFQKWSRCQCECKYPSTTCSDPDEEWNSDICACDCRKDIRKRCIRKGKLLDKSSCKCVCPPVTCPPDHVVNRANCKCIASPNIG